MTNSGEGSAVVPSACAGSAAITSGTDFPDGDGRKLERSAADDERIAMHDVGHAAQLRDEFLAVSLRLLREDVDRRAGDVPGLDMAAQRRVVDDEAA